MIRVRSPRPPASTASRSGLAFKPETAVADVVPVADAFDLVLCMSIEPGYSGQEFMPDALDRIRELRASVPEGVHVQVDGGISNDNIRSVHDAGADLLVCRLGDLRDGGPAARLPAPRPGARVTSSRPGPGARRARARHDSAEPGRGRRRRRGRRGRRRGLARAQGRAACGGGRARGGRRAGAWSDALRDDGALRAPRLDAAVHRGGARGRRCTRGRRFARPEPGGRRRPGVARRRRRRGRARRLVRGARTERGMADVGRRRAPVRHAEARGHARRPCHGARRALGDGRGEPPPRPRAARRLGRGRGRHGDGSCGRSQSSTRATSTPHGSPGALRSAAGPCRTAPSWSCCSGPLDEELRRLAAEGVQSLLLEGGPTLATAFLEHDLVDRLLVFVAPTIAGDGPLLLGALPRPVELHRLSAEPVGPDVLLDAYIHEP